MLSDPNYCPSKEEDDLIVSDHEVIIDVDILPDDTFEGNVSEN